MTAIHQFVPTLVGRDAVGGHTREVQRTLTSMGIESEIFACSSPGIRGIARPIWAFADKPTRGDTYLLYQASTGSWIAEMLLKRLEPMIVDYHNITPPVFFAPWEPKVAAELAAGLRQVQRLAGRAVAGWGDSSFNESDLLRFGYRRTRVVPILFDPSTFERDVDETALGRMQAARSGGGADWLFVGRLAPNKAQQDLVKALAAYRQAFDPKARLHLVGVASSHAYLKALERFVAELGLSDAVEITGSVSAGELSAYYRSADVFVCASEHEGFCVPFLEAMHHRVPIVAFGAAAVPETLDGAGLVLRSKSPQVFASAVARVLADSGLRERLMGAGTARLADFSLERSRARLVSAINELL
jgi:glycosyltransferase involved in cell wall biosynthesis